MKKTLKRTAIPRRPWMSSASASASPSRTRSRQRRGAIFTGLAIALGLAAGIPAVAQADQYPCGAGGFTGSPCAITGTAYTTSGITPTSYGVGVEARWYAFWAPAGTTVTLSIHDDNGDGACTVLDCTQVIAYMDLEPEIANPIVMSVGDGHVPPGSNYGVIPPSTSSYTTTTAGVWDVIVGGGRYADGGPPTVSYTLAATATDGYFQWPPPGTTPTGGPAPAPIPTPPPKPAPKPPVNPCTTGKAFPHAHTADIGQTSIHNYQSSVEMVVCDHFGYSGKVGIPIAQMVCGVVASASGWVGNKWKIPNLARLSTATDGACTAAEVAGTGSVYDKAASITCSWAADLLGAKTPTPAFFLGVGCAVAPVIGNLIGTWLESKHEQDVAISVIRSGKCIKYSPRHFPSPWLSVDCAPNDRRFQ